MGRRDGRGDSAETWGGGRGEGGGARKGAEEVLRGGGGVDLWALA